MVVSLFSTNLRSVPTNTNKNVYCWVINYAQNEDMEGLQSMMNRLALELNIKGYEQSIDLFAGIIMEYINSA